MPHLAFLQKNSILNVQMGSGYASGILNVSNNIVDS